MSIVESVCMYFCDENEAVQSHRPFVGQAANACFCNGPLEVNPFLRFVTAGHASVRGQRWAAA